MGKSIRGTLHLSIKTEMLNRLVLIDNHYVRELCISYQDLYNKKRPHQGVVVVTHVFPINRNEYKP